MPICRVYLCTYRRPQLLSRAIESLLNQTCKDWICELHNDDPEDQLPAKLVKSIGDSRIKVVNHEKNLGPTQTFNLIFQKVDEKFVSLLEDDNWWNPNFLENMIEVMQNYPQVDIAWANMRMWQENEDGSWTDLEKSTFPFTITESYKLYNWPHIYQIVGSLHSQGAMLVKTNNIENYQVPASTPSAVIEHVRERCYSYPILFVNQELGNFAVTRDTSRSQNPAQWGASQLLLAASFFRNISLNPQQLKTILQIFRQRNPSQIGILLWSGILYSECRYILKNVHLIDWIRFIFNILKRPGKTYKFLKTSKNFICLDKFLDLKTQKISTPQVIQNLEIN